MSKPTITVKAKTERLCSIWCDDYSFERGCQAVGKCGDVILMIKVTEQN